MSLGIPSVLRQTSVNSSSDPETGWGSFTPIAGAVIFAAVASRAVTSMSLSTDGAGVLVGDLESPYLGVSLSVYRWENATAVEQTLSVDWTGGAPSTHQALKMTQFAGADLTTPHDGEQEGACDACSSISETVTSEVGNKGTSFITSEADMTHGDTGIGSNQQRGATDEWLGASYIAGAASVVLDHSSLSNQSVQVACNVIAAPDLALREDADETSVVVEDEPFLVLHA